MGDEVARRLVHATGAVIPLAWVLDLLTWPEVRTLLLVGTGVALLLEFLRLVVGVDHAIYDRLTREYEQDNLAGYALYAIGATVAALSFGPTVAVPAMFMLMLGDPVSGLLGAGELRDVKAFWVLGAMFAVCLAVALPFLPLAAAAAAALAATVADGVKPVVRGYVIDDNLTIPIASSVVGYAVLTYLPV